MEAFQHFCWHPESEYSTGVRYLVGYGIGGGESIRLYRRLSGSTHEPVVGVLVRSPFPWRVRSGEIDRNLGLNGPELLT